MIRQQKIVIAGGSGFIGQALTRSWMTDNEVVILTRETGQSGNRFQTRPIHHPNVRYVHWDGTTAGDWQEELEEAGLLLNLAGLSVNCRYTEANRQAILESRLQTTAALGDALLQCSIPPRVWINAASATIYRHAEDRPQDEYSGELGEGFSVDVCRQWESLFRNLPAPRTRKVLLRMAITLGEDGALVPYLRLVKAGLGGSQGGGHQMFSWLHIADLERIISWAFGHEAAKGIYNAASPHPVSNQCFMQWLRTLTGRRWGLPLPAWLLRWGAQLTGTEAELVLKSRWVIPRRLQHEGFDFQYPEISSALRQILQHKAALLPSELVNTP
jgi:uncharacterized protein (TIGR01777 family)